jgi:hypothetical protein
MLTADPDTLTAHDIASGATWADRYRDSDRGGSRQRYEQTRQWHFVNIELDGPNLDRACFGHPRLPAAVPASSGPAKACLVDKIEQFTAELSNSATAPGERLLALEFLLHLVGDVHQPLHAVDDHDAGGNRKQGGRDRIRRRYQGGLQVCFGRPGCALNRQTWSPVKGSSARVSPIRSAIVVRQRFYWIPATDTDIISAQHFSLSRAE